MNLLIKPTGAPTESLTTTLVAFSPQEAYAAITILAIASDGYLANEELDAITSHLARMHLFHHFRPDTMQRMYAKLFEIMRKDGADVLLESAKETLPIELRESAFAMCCDLTLADGMMAQDEQAFLLELHQVLEIPKETADRILSVMQIRNRG
jgi:tellurite resistance protein